jgi:hypothetical protein
MTRVLAVVGLAMSCLLLADDHVKMERVEFPPGTLHLKRSLGEVRVEGWDRPDAEITTVTSPKLPHDKVRISIERHGDELVIDTELPRRRSLPLHSAFGAVGAYLEYNIKVPQTARLVVDHDVGDVHVNSIAGTSA